MEFWCGISARELDYVRSFARGVESWTDHLQLYQLRCLWTAYCFHQDMEVDTFSYDNELMQIWQNMCGADEILILTMNSTTTWPNFWFEDPSAIYRQLIGRKNNEGETNHAQRN